MRSRLQNSEEGLLKLIFILCADVTRSGVNRRILTSIGFAALLCRVFRRVTDIFSSDADRMAVESEPIPVDNVVGRNGRHCA